jgi:hypothetical protein
MWECETSVMRKRLDKSMARATISESNRLASNERANFSKSAEIKVQTSYKGNL